MSRLIVHHLVDDLDGHVLDAGKGETVTFAFDGVTYEIDLSDANVGTFREVMGPYISAGRRVVGKGRPAKPRRRHGQRDLGPVRAWAKNNGHVVSDRGRVPQAVIAAFDAAHSAPAHELPQRSDESGVVQF